MTTWTTDNGIMVLSPTEGMRLTDGETVAEGEVYLGANAAPGTWREVTEAEAEEIRKEAESSAESESSAEVETVAVGDYDSMRGRAEAAEALASRRGSLIQRETERLREEKADLEEKVASAAYIALRPWLRLKLAAVDEAIRKLEEDEGA